jgi:hypothetical protein
MSVHVDIEVTFGGKKRQKEIYQIWRLEEKEMVKQGFRLQGISNGSFTIYKLERIVILEVIGKIKVINAEQVVSAAF